MLYSMGALTPVVEKYFRITDNLHLSTLFEAAPVVASRREHMVPPLQPKAQVSASKPKALALGLSTCQTTGALAPGYAFLRAPSLFYGPAIGFAARFGSDNTVTSNNRPHRKSLKS